jgi:hypothetical protein
MMATKKQGEFKMGYHFSKGTTTVEYFWGDMHYYSIRADVIINDRKELNEFIARFESDKTQFDVVDYNTGYNLTKAVREYTVAVRKRIDFEVITFEHNGQTYRTKTRKHSKVMEISKKADKIIAHKMIQTMCLVDDATGDVIGIGDILGETDMMWEF